ncbi:MAG: hypothetical protein U5K69_06040 [Balneolaceae bacterium]|nr:hypothetical protein [Balneolaceae bacterium]
MDLADRQIVGWSFSEGMSADETIIPAWKAGLSKADYRPGAGLPF